MVNSFRLALLFTFLLNVVVVLSLIKHWYFGYLNLFLLVLILIGLIILWMGVLTLKENISLLPKARDLITYNIYSKIRHPMYWGIILILVGFTSLLKSFNLLLISILMILLLMLRAYFEEKVLLKKFGKRYKDYKKKTWF